MPPHPNQVYPLLKQWYRDNARDLPWRHTRDPWAILVCEVMSQQTPVRRVEPTWRVWLERWPQPADLAQASPADILRVWDRMGYPRRALQLHACAIRICQEHDGRVPSEEAALLALPGIGPYTAAAIRAFAFHEHSIVVDTNIRRVLARWHGMASPTRTGRIETEYASRYVPAEDTYPSPAEDMTQRHSRAAYQVYPAGTYQASTDIACHIHPDSACRTTTGTHNQLPANESQQAISDGIRHAITDDDHPAPSANTPSQTANTNSETISTDTECGITAWEWNAAIMEFGALICTARNPLCDHCPVRSTCDWARSGFPDAPHDSPQRSAAWEGTNRQARGAIMAYLREHSGTYQQLLDHCNIEESRIERALAQLLADGLAAQSGEIYHLPGLTV
ncbi:hypothetical protein [Trueperella sp. LYQ141]|uniref:hypothetical protein n=1 Tax=Trueperella sp. LYQ141 TaxID=3391058 RepID=UPI003983BBC6